jgi:putative transposase
MLELAAERPRFGYPRIHILLRREGFEVNRKRTYRIYREEKLQVRRKRRKRVAAAPREAMPVPDRPHKRWSMDFVSDSLMDGRALRVLNVVDDCTRTCVALEVDVSLSGERVGRVLDRAAARHGWPDVIVTDNGPEFTSKALDQWAWERGIRIHFIQPGKPVQNAFVESMNGKFRTECLSENWFTSLDDARRTIESWRRDYNRVRPHKSLGGMTPEQYELSLSSGSPLRGSPPDRLPTPVPPASTGSNPNQHPAKYQA